MSLLSILLSILLFLDCIILVFLVLLQLPKKEAGAGMAFGGAATDALFGAGSGNVLTKITKYVAGIFFALALILAMMSATHKQLTPGGQLVEELKKGGASASIPISPNDTGPATLSSNSPGSAPAPSMLLTNLPAPSASSSAATNK